MKAVIATLRVRPDKAAEFEASFGRLAAEVKRVETGCLLYQLARSPSEPGLYKVMELYTSAEAMADHMGSEHFRSTIGDVQLWLTAEPAIDVLDAVAGGEAQ